MKRWTIAGLCLLLLCTRLAFSAEPNAPESDPLLGKWLGKVSYGDESKNLAMRFEIDKTNATVVYVDIPEIQFHNLGPIHVKLDGDTYKAYVFTFHLAPDHKSISGQWSFDGHDLHFELKPGELPQETAPATSAVPVAQPVWTFKTGGAIWSSPAVSKGIVYFGSNDGNIYALKSASGKLLWSFKTGGAVMASPTLNGHCLYVISDDGFLYKVNTQTGKPVWKFDTHAGAVKREINTGNYDYQTSAAGVANGVVMIGSADKRVYAIDDATGKEKWHFDTQDIVRSTPVVSDGMVFVGGYDHFVYALDAKTGSLKWKHDTLEPVLSTPLVVKDVVYIGGRCSDLFAFDANTGNIKWKYFYWSSWVESSARIKDGILYVGSSDIQQLFAINAATGKRIWNFGTDGSAWSSPAVTDKTVYIGAVGVLGYFINHHGGFFAVDRVTGKTVWRYPMTEIPGSATYGVASSPAVDQGLVLFGGLDGSLYAFPEKIHP